MTRPILVSQLFILAAAVVAGCGDDGTGDVDSGDDAGVMLDAGLDGNLDGGGDGGLPSGCDGVYEGDPSWTDQWVVQPDARLCAYPPDNMRLDHEGLADIIARKSYIVATPGTYTVPPSSGEGVFRLPVCIVEGDTATPIGAASSFEVRPSNDFLGPDGDYLDASFSIAGEEPLLLTLLRMDGEANYEFNVPLPPDWWDAAQLTSVVATRFAGDNERFYTRCDLPVNYCLEVQGDGVDLLLEEYRWAGSPGRGFAAGQAIEGTFGDTSIAIEGYDQISTLYSRHAFSRAHFFAFDAPDAEGRCGVRIEVESQFVTTDGDFITYADCDGEPIGEPTPITATMVDCE